MGGYVEKALFHGNGWIREINKKSSYRIINIYALMIVSKCLGCHTMSGEVTAVSNKKTTKKRESQPSRGLMVTEKMVRLVDEYMITMNRADAAKRAGYKCWNGSEVNTLFEHPWVVAEIARLKAERSQRLQIDSDYVVRTIHDTIERCRQAVPVLDKKGEPVYIETPEGKIVPAYAFQPMAVLKGCQLLGQHVGMWDGTGKPPGGSSGASVKFEGSIEELRDIVRQVVSSV